MVDADAKLRATASDIIDEVGRLQAVVLDSRSVDPADDRASLLADQAVDIASRLIPKTKRERMLAEEASRE